MTSSTAMAGFMARQLRAGAVALLASLFAQAYLTSQTAVHVRTETRRGDSPALHQRFTLTRSPCSKFSIVLTLTTSLGSRRWSSLMCGAQTCRPTVRSRGRYAWGANHSKLIVVDQVSQAFAAYQVRASSPMGASEHRTRDNPDPIRSVSSQLAFAWATQHRQSRLVPTGGLTTSRTTGASHSTSMRYPAAPPVMHACGSSNATPAGYSTGGRAGHSMGAGGRCWNTERRC